MSETETTPAPPAQVPDKRGYFGEFGGRFVPETLIPLLDDLDATWKRLRRDKGFKRDLDALLEDFAGRPTPITVLENLSASLGGARIVLKREDLLHTGAHKLNNALGQALVAKAMGKKRIVAETGAGQHGVAVATVCAKLGLEAHVYMGATDVKRQRLNVLRMGLLGARVIPVERGDATLKEAISDAIRDWIENVGTTYYLLGSCVGPHPYPAMVRDLQRVIGVEARAQTKKTFGKLPDHVVACVGGGSNAIGLFHPFVEDREVTIWGVEAGGRSSQPGDHSATLGRGRPGVLHGCKSMLLQDEDGQVAHVHSISAGLDYPGVGPEHAWLKETGRARYVEASDDEALAALERLAREEGIIAALESSHAVAHALRLAPSLPKDALVLVGLSGRGDKDLGIIEEARASKKRGD